MQLNTEGYSKIKGRSKSVNEAISDLSSAPLFGVFSGIFLGKRYVRIGGNKDEIIRALTFAH